MIIELTVPNKEKWPYAILSGMTSDQSWQKMEKNES